MRLFQAGNCRRILRKYNSEVINRMVTIRLSRTGTKGRPFYHIVVVDSRTKRGGRSLERLGFFNPVASGNEEKLRIDTARVDYWKSNGAQTSERVEKLLKDYSASA
jgi:small subunit ribosomal protein S16